MEPFREPAKRHPSLPWLLGTALVLVFAFIAIIFLFFGFSALAPSFMGSCVAVVNIDNELTVQGTPQTLFDSGMPGSEDIARSIRELNKRDDVGAVLLVIDSPGGSVVATREIYDAVKSLDKPKVAYFREVAASGAYYVGSGTDYIISDPDALTGSIGVIATVTDMSGLLDKLGVNVTAITSGPHKDIGSSFRDMTPEERQIMQAVVDEIYGEFRGVVLENRKGKLDLDKFNNVSDGRILSGRQAAAVGLVDKVGSKRDAIMKAAALAGIQAGSPDDVKLCEVSPMVQEGGLFSAASVLRQFEAKTGVFIGYR